MMIQRYSTLCTLFLILVVLAQPLSAQWTKIDGSHGGSTRCLAVHGFDLFAGTDGGLFRSSDTGKHWIPVNLNIAVTVSCMAFIGDTLFVGTHGAGVFRSTNGAATWTQIDPSSINLNIHALLATPDGVGGTNLFAATGGGMYLLPDHGTAWNNTDPALTSTDVTTLASEPVGTGGMNIFAGTDGPGIFLSTDNGATWTLKNNGLSSVRRNLFSVNSFAVTDSGIYAVVGNLYRSTDHGSSWTARSELPDTNMPFVTLVAGMGSRLFATNGRSVFSSTNNGGLWSFTGGGLPKNIFSPIYQTIFCFAEKDSLLLVGTVAGVFRSTDKGVTWGALNDGLDASAVSPLSASGRNVFAVGGGGYYITHSPDNGATWVPWVDTVHYHFASLASNDSILVTQTDYPTDGGYAPVLRYNAADGHRDSIGMRPPYAIAVNDAYIFTGGLYGFSEAGVGRCSVDSSNWTFFREGLNSPLSIYTLGTEGSTIWAGRSQMGISRSTDNGVHWSGVNNGFDTTTVVTAFAFNGSTVFAGTGTPPNSNFSLRGSVFRTTDGGAHWNTVNNDLTDTSIVALALHGTTILAGTDSGGVFVSTNNGQSWRPFNDGLPRLDVSSLVMNDAYIYAGVPGGLWRRPLSETVTSLPANRAPGRYALEQNYPNPFNPTTTIRYELPHEGRVTLKVYSVLGQEVMTLVNNEQPAGRYVVELNGQTLATGVYFYRLQAGDFVQTRKVILVK
jgi:photosystem II stability/assembly factor-like uncharacterized protein